MIEEEVIRKRGEGGDESSDFCLTSSHDGEECEHMLVADEVILMSRPRYN